MTVSRTALVITALVSACAGGGIVYLGLRGASTGIVDPPSPPVRDFALLDQDGRFHQLYRLTKAKAVVLYIHGLGCTTVRDSLPALKALRATYAKQGVEFMLINANPQDDRKALQAEAARLHLDLPILKDEAQLVIQSLQAERTGEAILIDTKTWAIRYRGPIDDRMHYGSQRPAATRHYLNDALAAVLDKETVAVAQAPVFGCVLNIEPDRRPLSYAGDVVPILRDRCIDCHRAGGVGPWAMDRYETVRAWSPMMREVIMTKRMPPWQADPAVGELLADRSLRTEEQKTLVRWIDAGAPRGDGPDPLAAQPPEGVKGWPLGEPDLVINLPEQKLPAQGVLPYRWLKIPVPIDKDRWVRAVQLKPSNTAVMHHGFRDGPVSRAAIKIASPRGWKAETGSSPPMFPAWMCNRCPRIRVSGYPPDRPWCSKSITSPSARRHRIGRHWASISTARPRRGNTRSPAPRTGTCASRPSPRITSRPRRRPSASA